MLALRSRLLSITASSTIRRAFSDACKSLPKWVVLARELDFMVASRSSAPKLHPQDSHLVAELCHEICHEYADANGQKQFDLHRNAQHSDSKAAAISNQERAQCNLVAHFFVARLFEGSALQIRAHVLTGESEDNAHSHGASFFSHCISGGYTHEIWNKVLSPPESCEDTTEMHFYETKRVRSSLPSASSLHARPVVAAKPSSNKEMFSESLRRAGKFIMSETETHEHRRGDIYFMDAADIFHKVCVRRQHLVGSPSVTLVVRGRRATFEGSHFVTVGAPLGQTVIDGASVDPDEVTREKYLSLLRGVMQEYCEAGGGASKDGGEGAAYRTFESSHA